MTTPYPPPYGVPGAPVPPSPYRQRMMGGAPAAPVAAGGWPSAGAGHVEDRRAQLEALFAGAPPGVARMLAQWVVTHRPNWEPAAITPGTVAIGDRLGELAPGQASPLNLTVPTTTGFYALAITTRDAQSRALVQANTDVLFSFTNKVGRHLFGSSGHLCPVAPFDPVGHGFTHVAPFLLGDGEKLRISLQNTSDELTYSVVVSVMGLGLYTPEGGTQ